MDLRELNIEELRSVESKVGTLDQELIGLRHLVAIKTDALNIAIEALLVIKNALDIGNVDAIKEATQAIEQIDKIIQSKK